MPSLQEKYADFISQGKIPANDRILQAIDAGQIDIETVSSRYNAIKSPKKEPVIVQATEPPVKKVFQARGRNTSIVQPIEMPKAGDKDGLINKMVMDGDLPNSERVLSAIKDGSLDINDAVSRYSQIRNTGIPKTNGTEETFTKSLVEKGVNPIAVPAQAVEEFNTGEFLLKKFAQGATFDIYDPEIDAPDDTMAVMGFVSNLVGGTVAAIASAPLIASLPFVGAIGAAAKGVSVATKGGKVLKTALNVGKVAAEAATLGAGVGAVKGTIRGDDFGDILTGSLTEAATFAGGAAAMYPFVVGGAKLFKAGARKFARTAEQEAALQATPEIKQLAERVSLQLKNEPSDLLAKKMDDYVSQGIISKDQARIFNGISKINEIKPTADLTGMLLSNPEVLHQMNKENISKISRGLFSEKTSPFKFIYDTNANVKQLVDTGKHSEAIDTLRSHVFDIYKTNKPLQEFTLEPFMADAAKIRDVHADRILNSKEKFAEFPNLKRTLLSYLGEPTEQNASALLQERSKPYTTQSGKTVSKRFTKKDLELVSSGKYLQKPLADQEAEEIVSSILDKNLRIIAGEKLPLSDVGHLKDMDSMIKAAVWFRGETSRDLISSFKMNAGTLGSDFGNVDPMVKPFVMDALKLRRFTTERSLALQEMRELKLALIKNNSDPASSEAIKSSMREVTAFISNSSKQMKTIQFDLKNAFAEGKIGEYTLDDVMKTAADIYLPSRRLLTSQAASKTSVFERRITEPAREGGVIQQNQFNEKFFPSQSTEFLKEGSDLAEMAHAMAISNIDTAPWKDTQLPIINLMNPSRYLNKEFGANSPVHRMLIEGYRSRALNVKQATNNFMKEIDAIGIKGGSKESAMLHAFAEGRITSVSPEFMALNPKTQDQIISGSKKLRGIYDSILDKLNTTARTHGLPEVARRADYVTHFKEMAPIVPEMWGSFLRGDQDFYKMFIGDGKKNFKLQKMNGDPKRPFLAWELERKGGDFVEDAIGALKKYVEPAMERIYYTDMVREIDTAKHFTPENLGNFMQKFKDRYLLNKPTVLDDETSQGLKTTLGVFRRKMAEGALFFNMNTAIQQLTSSALNFGISGRDAVKSIYMRGTNAGKEALSLSKLVPLRDPTEGADNTARLFKSKVLDKIRSGAVGTGYDRFKAVGSFAMELFDKEAASHAYLTGFNKAARAGATKEQAARFGDYWVSVIHADTSKIGFVPSQNSAWGRALLQFQSFTLNYAASILNDLPNIANSDGAGKAVSMIMKTYASASIANEIMGSVGLPSQFKTQSFIPFAGTARFGFPGYIGMMFQGAKAVTADERDEKQIKKDLTRSMAAIAFPGGAAFNRAYKAIKKNEDGEYESDKDFYMDMLFGNAKKK